MKTTLLPLSLIAGIVAAGSCRNFDDTGRSDVDGPVRDGGAGGSAGEPGEGTAGSESSQTNGGASDAPSPGGQGGESGQGGEAGAAEAPELGELVLLLEASRCDVDASDRATFCPDLSGFKNDARPPLAHRRPVLSPESVNGHAALLFDGGDAPPQDFAASVLRIDDAESLRLGTSDFTIVIVARWSNAAMREVRNEAGGARIIYAGYGGLLRKPEPNPPYVGLSIFCNYPSELLFAASFTKLAVQLELPDATAMSFANGLNDEKWRIASVQRVGGTKLGVRINGADQTWSQMSATLNVSAPSVPLEIGGLDGSPFRGEIAELRIIRGPTTSAELEVLENALKIKYQL